MKDKHLTIMWAWTSGLNFLGCIYNILVGNWLMVAFFGIYSILAMGLALFMVKE